MKKYIYSLAMLALGLSSCASWDDPVTEKYGDGPSVAITITETTDSIVVFKVTPAEGTQFYNYITDANDEAETLDAYTLLKGQYDNAANVRNVADNPYYIDTIKAEPNTVYQIYAVAASDKGIAGEVAVVSATTTDVNAPALVDDAFEPKAADKAVVATFDQNLVRGEGAVTAVYYKEWDFENPVVVEADSINVEIEDNVVTFSAPSTPDGAVVLYSWEAGAFVDAKGNKCGKFTSAYDEEEDEFIGAAVHNANVPFDVEKEYFTAPKQQSAFKDPKAFVGEVTFDFDIFRNEKKVKDGDFQVIFTNDRRSHAVNLTAKEWTLDGNKISFILPEDEGIEEGDIVTVSMKENVIFDVYGNGNNAFSNDTVWWIYVTMTPEEFIGTYNLQYISYFDEEETVVNGGNFTIELDPKEEDGLIIKDLYLKGSEIYATYDLATKTIIIPDGQPLGVIEEDGVKNGLLFATADGTDAAVWDIDVENGSLKPKSLWGIFALDETFKEEVDWWEVMLVSTAGKVVPGEEEASAARAAKRLAAAKKGKKSMKIVKTSSKPSLNRVKH